MATSKIVRIHPEVKPQPKTGRERTAAWRARQKEKGTQEVTPVIVTSPETSQAVTVTQRVTSLLPSLILMAVGLGFTVVGITVNGSYAESLGSTETSSKLFLAIGVCADLAAGALPAVAATLWHARQRGAAATAWAIWLTTFAFAVTAGIGFASTNISDVTSARAGRVTPAVAVARAALEDATAARDRECRGGVGKFCRQREDAVMASRAALDTAMKSVAAEADPQTGAAIKIVAWVSVGALHPTPDDFAMLRLVLLALLPQLGGLVMMIGRVK